MAYKILKLHGCSGAGKTTVARALMGSANEITQIIKDGQKRPEAYVCTLDDYDAPVVVLGSYESNCGGMDTVSSAAQAMEMVRYYHDIGHVLHEGLLQSTYYGAMGKDSEQYGDDYIYAFLDTPLLVCLDRVTRRRDVMKSKNKFDPQLTVDKFNTIERLKLKCIAGGRRVVTFDYQADPLGQLKTLFLGGA